MTEARGSGTPTPGERHGRLGIVGLGAMGGPMAGLLVAAGREVVGFDSDAERREAAARAGTPIVTSAADVGRAAEVVLTSLPSAGALAAVVGDLTAAVRAGGRCRVVAELSTLSLRDKLGARDELASAGIVMLDCPVSGTAIQVASRDISVYASGERTAYERCAPVLHQLARSVWYLGEFGKGSRTKFVANLLVATHIAAAAEALVLARRAGLDLEDTLAAVSDGAGTSRMLEIRGPMMIEGRYQPASMSIRLFDKDLRLIREYAASVGAPLPLLERSIELYEAAAREGRADEDTSSIYAILSARADARQEDGS